MGYQNHSDVLKVTFWSLISGQGLGVSSPSRWHEWDTIIRTPRECQIKSACSEVADIFDYFFDIWKFAGVRIKWI